MAADSRALCQRRRTDQSRLITGGGGSLCLPLDRFIEAMHGTGIHPKFQLKNRNFGTIGQLTQSIKERGQAVTPAPSLSFSVCSSAFELECVAQTKFEATIIVED